MVTGPEVIPMDVCPTYSSPGGLVCHKGESSASRLHLGSRLEQVGVHLPVPSYFSDFVDLGEDIVLQRESLHRHAILAQSDVISLAHV